MLDAVRRIDVIGLDPCADVDRPHGKLNYYGPPLALDGLSESWAGKGLVFCNPPFSRKGKWARKASLEASLLGSNTEIVMLVPNGICAAWFDPLLDGDALCFWKGRMKFVERTEEFVYAERAGAMFDVALAYFGPRRWEFMAAFDKLGYCIPLDGRRRAA